jgi:hypothetical protein
VCIRGSCRALVRLEGWNQPKRARIGGPVGLQISLAASFLGNVQDALSLADAGGTHKHSGSAIDTKEGGRADTALGLTPPAAGAERGAGDTEC